MNIWKFRFFGIGFGVKVFLLLGVVAFSSFSTSCNSDSINTSKTFKLGFSQDTLTFDTVFQSLGSATRAFRVYNPTVESVIISNVYLADSTHSQFQFNIDGRTQSMAQNIKILPRDSVWVFVTVKIDPQTNPLLVAENLVFSINGNLQTLSLKAFGQNIYLHKGEIITQNTQWLADKPHVVLPQTTASGTIPGILVAQGAKLTINAGCKVYFESSAGIFVQGSLAVKGTKDNLVKMGGIRLEQAYQHAAGQWIGLQFFRSSTGNLIQYADIDESSFGVWLGYQSTTDFSLMTDATRAQLGLENTTIRNAYYWCVRSLNNQLTATNCLFYTATDYLLQLALGGQYSLVNCTLYNSQGKQNQGVFYLSNQFTDNASQTTYANALGTCLFQNNIFYGTGSEQIVLNIDVKTNPTLTYTFQNCLYQSYSNYTDKQFSNCVLNSDPAFVSTDIDKEDFHLQSGSPCIDAGFANGLTFDISGNPRPKGVAVDMGAYEF